MVLKRLTKQPPQMAAVSQWSLPGPRLALPPWANLSPFLPFRSRFPEGLLCTGTGQSTVNARRMIRESHAGSPIHSIVHQPFIKPSRGLGFT